MLVEELGLASHVLGVNASAQSSHKRLVLARGRLHPLPASITQLLRPSLLSRAPLAAPTEHGQDESIRQFALRCFNDEVADYVMDPLTRNICAGCSSEVSARSLLPEMLLTAQQCSTATSLEDPSTKMETQVQPASQLLEKASHWSQWTLRKGLQELCDTLTECLTRDPRVHIYVNEPHVEIGPGDDGRLSLSFAESTMEVDHLFACIPARRLSSLLTHSFPMLASILLDIPSVHVVSVNLEYKGKVLPQEALGFLVPSIEKSNVLGMTFDSCCFPDHDGQYDVKTRITCLMGGKWFKELFGDIHSVDSESLLKAATESVHQHLGISEHPVRYQVSLLKESMPQHIVGHRERVSHIRKEISQQGLRMSVVGASYDGIGVNDCILQARQAAETYLTSLRA
ncbi:protoporphyrinogen oxidase-like isoform X2 [Ornithodoros turicata]